MGTTINRKELPKRPLILCTWFDDGEWHTYERLATATDLDAAFAETVECCVWSGHPTFEMQFIEYR